MQNKIELEYLTPKQAAEYLGCEQQNIKHLVANFKLKCGVFVPRWTGNAMPVRSIGQQHKWEGGVCETDANGKTYDFRCSITGDTFKVRNGFIAQFWYIEQNCAYELVTNVNDQITVSFLEPVDGNELHDKSPDRFPWERFIFWVDSDQTEPLDISWDRVLFRRQDLGLLVGNLVKEASGKAITKLSDNTLVSTIAALLALQPKGIIPTGKDLERSASSVGVSISDDSIRKALGAAMELAPSLKRD